MSQFGKRIAQVKLQARAFASAAKDFSAKHGVEVSIVGGALTMATNAKAALDPAVAGAFTALQSSFDDLLTAAYPVMISITVALVIFGLVKMFIHKAAGR